MLVDNEIVEGALRRVWVRDNYRLNVRKKENRLGEEVVEKDTKCELAERKVKAVSISP